MPVEIIHSFLGLFASALFLYFVILLLNSETKKLEEQDKDNVDSKKEFKTPHQKGRELEIKAINYYSSKGYNVVDCTSEDFKHIDLMGVDLIAKKTNQMLLIQCKNHTKLDESTIYKALYKLSNFYDLNYKSKPYNKLVQGRIVLSKENGKLPPNIYNIFASREDGSAYRKDFPIRYEMI